MRIELQVYGAEEMTALGEMFMKLGALRAAQPKDQPEDARPAIETEFVAQTGMGAIGLGTMPADAVIPAVKAKRTKKVVEAVAAAVEPVATAAVAMPADPTPAPAPVVAAPLGPVTKVWTNQEVVDAFRPHTRTNFVAAQALLKQFGVAKFSLLPAEKLQAFGDGVAALGPAPVA